MIILSVRLAFAPTHRPPSRSELRLRLIVSLFRREWWRRSSGSICVGYTHLIKLIMVFIMREVGDERKTVV